jgi:hypothetical protein
LNLYALAFLAPNPHFQLMANINMCMSHRHFSLSVGSIPILTDIKSTYFRISFDVFPT